MKFASKYLAAAASLAVCTQPAFAQSETAEEEQAQSGTIIVTGARPETVVIRESSDTALFGDISPRELPFAFNAINETEIKNRMAGSFSEVLLTDPAIDFGLGGGGDSAFEAFMIRGFGLGSTIYDGVPQDYYTTRPTETTSQVEILRGAAAFRYGFLSPGGAVNIVSKQPTEDPFLSVTGTGDTFGFAGIHFDAGGRMGASETFGYRVNVLVNSDPTYADDFRRKRYVAAGAFDARLGGATVLSLSGEYGLQKARGPGAPGYRQMGLWDGRLPDPIPDPEHQWLPEWDRSDVRELNLNARLRSTFAGDWTVDLAIGRTDKDEEVWGGSAFGPWSATGEHDLDYYGAISRPVNWNGVAQVYGSADTGPIRHNLAFGALYRRYRSDTFYAANSYSLTVPSSYENPAELPYIDPDYMFDTTYKDVQHGAFASDRMEIGKFGILAGVRWSRIRNHANAYADEAENEAVTPIGALSFTPHEGAMFYASFAEALEPGGRAPAGTTNQFQTMPPLRSNSYEIGFKLDLANGAATLDGSIFEIDKPAAYIDGTNTYVQSGRQVHRGAELIVKGKPVPWLQLSGGVQYLDAKFEDDPATDGNRPENVPRFRATLWAEHAVKAVPGLHISALGLYVGKREVSVPNLYQAPGYFRADLGARYEAEMGGTELVFRLQVNNLFDKRYWASAGQFQSEFGAPRSVMGSVEVVF